MSHAHNNLVGPAGEAAVAAELAAAGFHVYVPAFGQPLSDLVAELDGKLIRIQVKTHDCDGDCLRFTTWSIGTDSYVGAVDWLAFHSMRHGVTAFLKPEEAGVYPTIRYNDIGEARVQKNMRYARDFPLERVIKEIRE